jgi:transcription elongation factor Elf1
MKIICFHCNSASVVAGIKKDSNGQVIKSGLTPYLCYDCGNMFFVSPTIKEQKKITFRLNEIIHKIFS